MNLLKWIIPVLLLAMPATAQTWEPVGPSGGTFIGSVSDPADADTITAITTYPAPSLVYRTQNGGATWTQIGEVPYYYLYDMCAYDFSRLYAMASNYCYYSTDGGITWSSGQIPYGNGYARSVCVDPTDPLKVYASGSYYDSGTATYHMAFFASTDGGATWSASNFFTFEYFYAYDMAISKTDPDVLYVCGYRRVSGSYYLGMFKSEDAGATWTDISTLLETSPYRYAYTVAVDPLDENRVYAGGSYFYRSTDGGATWSKVTSPYFNARDIGIDPVNPSNLYMSAYNAVYTSTDHGVTWVTHSNAIKGSWSHVEVAPAAPSTIHIATTYSGFYRSTDSGATWNTAHNGVYAHVIYSMLVTPSQPESLYIDLYNSSELCHTDDFGATWNSVPYPSGCSASIGALHVNAMDPEVVLALEASG